MNFWLKSERKARRVRSVREERVCKTEGAGLREELEEIGHTGRRGKRAQQHTQKDDSLLSGCHLHLSTFTSPPSTTEGARSGERGAAYANVRHVDTTARRAILIACHCTNVAQKS